MGILGYMWEIGKKEEEIVGKCGKTSMKCINRRIWEQLWIKMVVHFGENVWKNVGNRGKLGKIVGILDKIMGGIRGTFGEK